MSASLIVLIPVVLLGVVTALCFVGCVFNTHGGGLQPDPGPYQDGIRINPNLIAFWPLNDPSVPNVPQQTAFDVADHPPGQNPFNGTYSGTFMLQQAGIVPGDVAAGAATASTCASFNVGMVGVPFHQELNASSFTLECWVKPNWTAGGPQNQRAVVVSAAADEGPNPTANVGYALVATPTNFWSAQIGIGTTFIGAMSKDPIVLDGVTTYYLAMTFDGAALTLSVGIVGGGLTTTPPVSPGAGQKFVSESPATATQLFIAMGRPDLPTTMQFPFNGSIQDVAYYSPALTSTDIQNNFALGGKPPG